jgi:small subunit ribosomal protein S16
LAVHIRLRRTGKKKQAHYRIVAADSRRARDGRFLEIIGTYNPIQQPASVQVNEDRLTYWFNQGAVPSDTVRSLLTQIGYVEKYHKMKQNQDVSGMELKTSITERKKKTRKVKKAAVAAAEAVAKEETAAAEAPAPEGAGESAPEAAGGGEEKAQGGAGEETAKEEGEAEEKASE